MHCGKIMIEKLKQINTFIFDVDGVLTNGLLIGTDNGELWRLFNAKDGFALKVALQKNYNLCIITGGTSIGVYKRFEQLGFKHIYYKVKDKLPVLKDFLDEQNIKAEQVLYIGDDLPDYNAMHHCGISACPNNAATEIKSTVDYICKTNGGEGCARELIEMVLKAQDNWYKL